MMKNKIVILDGHTLNPGDLSWDELDELGEVILYERTSQSEIQGRIADANIILTNKVPLGTEIISGLPDLKYIGVTATGYNIIDTEAAKKQGIVVTNVGGYGTDSVAQHTFALILEISNKVGQYSASVKNGDWYNAKDWTYTLQPLVELKGKTLGIVGFGTIGKKVAEIARVFGMNVISFHKHPERDRVPEVRFVDFEELMASSDVISLHCPLTKENHEMINKETLQKVRNNAILINTSRGGLINHVDLYDAVNSGKIGGVGLDVIDMEPPPKRYPLLSHPKCIVTPHIAWASYESRKRLLEGVILNLKSYLKGKTINRIF